MRASIISIGDELLRGQVVDTNSAWLAERLEALGVRLERHVTVGDGVEVIAAATIEALRDSEVVVLTGGLGPTLDDVTRAGVAWALGVDLYEDPEALRQIEGFFVQAQRSMPEANRLQAQMPRGCTVIANPRGTAPGVSATVGQARLFALPGVPAEMKAMFGQTIAPALGGPEARESTQTRCLHCFGAAEATIGEALAALMERGRNPEVGTTASAGVISVRITATGTDAEVLGEEAAAEVRRRLGDLVFGEGDQTLESVVGRLLTRAGQTVATAESCTGGLLAKCFTDVPGSSAYFVQGYITYSNHAKVDLLGVPVELLEREGAVSALVAEAMARGCHTAANADFALATTGIAGPDGGRPPEKPVGLVYVALATAEGVEVKRLILGDYLARAEIRDRAAKVARNMLRLRLLGAG